jgi:hypothetical protein
MIRTIICARIKDSTGHPLRKPGNSSCYKKDPPTGGVGWQMDSGQMNPEMQGLSVALGDQGKDGDSMM